MLKVLIKEPSKSRSQVLLTLLLENRCAGGTAANPAVHMIPCQHYVLGLILCFCNAQQYVFPR